MKRRPIGRWSHGAAREGRTPWHVHDNVQLIRDNHYNIITYEHEVWYFLNDDKIVRMT